MKKIRLIIPVITVLFLIDSYTVKAQNDTLAQILQDVKNRYDALDHTGMATNLLFNKGFLILNDLEELHNGSDAITSLNKWEYYYKAINHSKLTDSLGLPDFKTLVKDNIESKKYETSTIGFSLLCYKGDYLPDTAIKTMIYSNNFANPPYEQMTIFAGTVLLPKVYNKSVKYSYKPANLFTNRTDIQKLMVDFGDGNGYITINPTAESSINAEYDCIGEKSIMFKLFTTGGDTLLCYSKINIAALALEMPTYEGYINYGEEFKLFDPIKAEYAGINAPYINYRYHEGCDGVLDKPVIIAEGFDVVGTSILHSYDWFIDNALIDFDGYWQGRYEELRSHGYDVFVINFNAPDHTLQNNAESLKEIIKEINNHKIGFYESIYIGESMAGIIGRIALKELENEGYDHQFGLYVSYDAPHKGANIPLGIQYIVNDLYLTSGSYLGYSSDIIEELIGIDIPLIDVFQTLNSNGARQLIAKHYMGAGLYDAFQTYLDNLGYPDQTRNIAYVNGSNDGTLQVETMPEYIINRTLLFVLGFYSISAKAKYTNPTEGNQVVAEFIAFNLLTGGVHYLRHRDPNSLGEKPWDNAPGGFQEHHVPAIFNSNTTNIHFCFVPTVSAIDIDRSIFDAGNFTYLNDFDPTHNAFALVAQNLTPFDDIYIDNDNATHTTNEDNISNAVAFAEIMYDNMYLQNRIIDKNRDFEAINILAGSELDMLTYISPFENSPYTHTKYIDNGKVIIKSGSIVNFNATQSISLEPGFETEQGATFATNIGSICSSSKNTDNAYIETPVIICKSNVCGNQTFTTQTSGDNLIEWKLTGNNLSITNYGNDFTIPDNMQKGQYTIYCSQFNDYSEASSSRTIQVKCGTNFNNKNESKQSLIKINDIVLYPNPSSGIFYLSIQSEYSEESIVSIKIFDVLNRLVHSENTSYNQRIKIDVSNQAKGVYYSSITINDKTYIATLIKN
jgi:hypothetical protein